MAEIVKTVLKVTVLSAGTIDHLELETIGHEIIYGSMSGHVEVESTEILKTKEAVTKACEEQGTDPSFFLGDD